MRVKQVHGAVVRVLKKGRKPAGGSSAETPDADAIVSIAPGSVYQCRWPTACRF